MRLYEGANYMKKVINKRKIKLVQNHSFMYFVIKAIFRVLCPEHILRFIY